MHRLIAFSLFGTGAKYCRGAVENALLAPRWYPGWKVRFYVGPEVPLETVADLARAGAEVVEKGAAPGGRAMCWRFEAAAEAGWDAVVCRDADSRLNPREAAAVSEWIDSGEPFHCMHDHEHHRPWPVFGGMWGCRGCLPEMLRWIEEWPRWGDRLDDMKLLREHLHPLMLRRGVVRHSSVPVEWPCRPFPPHEAWAGFVGQVVD